MRRITLALIVTAVLLAACMPKRPDYEAASPVSQQPPSVAAPSAPPAASADVPSPSPAPDVSGALDAEYTPAEFVGDPSELALDGSLSWIWENPIDQPERIAAMYSMCAAVTGKKDGRDCVWAGQVYPGGIKPVYTAGEEYPHINSVSGSKFSVYFIEHNESRWRLMYLPLDSDPDQAEVIDEGEGLIPVLSAYTDSTLAYAVQMGGNYAVRVWEKAWDGDIVTKPLKDIPLDGAPLEPDHAYSHDVFAGIAYAAEVDGGWAIVTHDMEGSPLVHRVRNRPVNPQATETGIAWMDETGRLFFWLRGSETTFLLGEGVAWYDLSFGVLFADQDAMRLVYAQRIADGDALLNEMGCIALSQGSWKYIGGTMFNLGENYACVLRERDGGAQFAGTDLTLMRGD